MTIGPQARLALVALVVWMGLSPSLAASETRFLRLASRDDFLGGTLDGIAVDSLGALLLAERAEKIGEVGEPFLFTLAAHPRGWVVGTGNGGKVLLIDRQGEVETLFVADEPEIFTVWVDADGSVLAGSSPNGKVYRIADGEGEVVFDPDETYIWDLARGVSGDLLVATGGEGRLYAVDPRGEGELLYDTGDTHLRRIAVREDGEVLLGTAGEGLILRWSPKTGRAQTLYDSVYPEVVAFAEGGDGEVYAALIASEASQIDLSAPAQKGGEDGDGEESNVSVAAAAAAFAGSRPSGFSGDRSLVLRIGASGVAEPVWRFEQETVYSLAWRDGKLWVGTGLEGKLFGFLGGQMTLEKDVDERQVVAVVAGPGSRPGPSFATTNGAALYRVTGQAERRGVFTSAALDAGEVSSFGTLAWRGDRPSAATVRFSVRSGMSAEPDDTWSSWSEPRNGSEIPLAGTQPGRYLQWRARLESGNGASPVLREVVVSYRQNNLAPEISSLTVLPPGEIRVPANFNPGNQVFEPVAPTKNGIFTTLEAANGQEQRGQKTLWKKGWRTLAWEAKDPNGDELSYVAEFRRQGGEGWLPLLADLEEEHVSFDASALPDGEYRFRVRAVDRSVDSGDPGLTAERTSEPVINDHTPPELTVTAKRGRRLELRLSDEWSPLSRLEMAVDAGEWRPLTPDDGLLDARRETVAVDLPPSAQSVLLRVMDVAYNAVTFDLLEVSE